MVPLPSHCNPLIRKGAWSKKEDVLLRRCIEKYGEGNWHLVPSRAVNTPDVTETMHYASRRFRCIDRACCPFGVEHVVSVYIPQSSPYGLNRCRKSCRLRWLNYLSPNIKRGPFAPDEDDLIVRMHRLLGNRWSLIAGRMLGRTANDIKNRWNSHLNKEIKVALQPRKEAPPIPSVVVIKPQAHRLTVKAPYWFKTHDAPTAEAPAGTFIEEQFSVSSWFDPKCIQGGGGGGNLQTPHETREESLFLLEVLLDLDGKEFPLQATAADMVAELEWENLLSDPEFWSSLDVNSTLKTSG